MAGFWDLARIQLDYALVHPPYDQVIFLAAESHPYCHDDGLRAIDDDFRIRIDRQLWSILQWLHSLGAIKELRRE